jgi:hypothetical protein
VWGKITYPLQQLRRRAKVPPQALSETTHLAPTHHGEAKETAAEDRTSKREWIAPQMLQSTTFSVDLSSPVIPDTHHLKRSQFSWLMSRSDSTQ